MVHGLEGGPAVADLRDVPAHDVGAGVVDRTEPPAPPLLRGVEPGGVASVPHRTTGRWVPPA